MNRKLKQGLIAVLGTAVGSIAFGYAGCAGNKVYEIPEQGKCMAEGKKAEECCTSIDRCGIMCYNGFTEDGGGFMITMNGKRFMYSTMETQLYPCGCHLERGEVSSDSLVVVQNLKQFDLP